MRPLTDYQQMLLRIMRRQQAATAPPPPADDGVTFEDALEQLRAKVREEGMLDANSSEADR